MKEEPIEFYDVATNKKIENMSEWMKAGFEDIKASRTLGIRAKEESKWIHGESPRDGELYWVAVILHDNKPIVFLATAWELAANGWESVTGWEDWDKEVIAYQKAIIPTYP